jgi:hypothetical protein
MERPCEKLRTNWKTLDIIRRHRLRHGAAKSRTNASLGRLKNICSVEGITNNNNSVGSSINWRRLWNNWRFPWVTSLLRGKMTTIPGQGSNRGVVEKMRKEKESVGRNTVLGHVDGVYSY